MLSLFLLRCLCLIALIITNVGKILFRLDSTKGTYAKEWTKWEKQLREVLNGNAEYLNSIQVNIQSLLLKLSNLYC